MNNITHDVTQYVAQWPIAIPQLSPDSHITYTYMNSFYSIVSDSQGPGSPSDHKSQCDVPLAWKF